MKGILHNNRGVALILVLLIVSVIVALTLQLNVTSRAQIYEAANLGDGIRALYISKSGLYGAAMILANDRNDYDALTEEWANLEAISEQSRALFDGGYMKLKIEDETGKIQVNRLVERNVYNSDIKDLLSRLLNLPEFKLSPGEVEDILSAIKDWIDTDSEVTGNGAENAYYGSLPTPYACKNGPLDDLEELLKVRGITPDLYYGKDDRPGLAKFLSTEGSGRININTAPLPVLRALAPNITESMALEMDAFRRKEIDRLSDPLWYKRVTDMDSVSLNSNGITTKSEVFSITSQGLVGTLSRSISGMVQKGTDQKIKILSWKVR